MPEFVDAFDDARLTDYRNVSDAELLAARGVFVAESRLVVARLLASPRFRTRSLMLTRTASMALADSLAARPDVTAYEVSQDTMNRVTGFNLHRGCLAIGERPEPLALDALTLAASRLIALERVGNADNVGSIFRNAAAFGADAVLIDESSADPLYRKALRTSMGAALQVPFARARDWRAALANCRRQGMRLIALTPSPDAPPIRDVARGLAGLRVALVLGHEGEGLTEATMRACDLRARIQVAGVDSLNVATAAAIALYKLRAVCSLGSQTT